MKKDRVGQGIVEFAVVLPIILLLVMGALELGRAFYMKIVLTNAARAGAYYLSYHPNEIICLNAACTPGPSAGPEVVVSIQNEGNSSGVNIQAANISMQCTVATINGVKQCNPGDAVTVTVTQNIRLMIFRFLGGNIPLVGQVRMRVQ